MERKNLFMRNEVAAVVVLFNPNERQTFDNIMTYVDCVDRLYIVDNGSDEVCESLKYIKNTEYIRLKKNMGIAYALNLALEKSSKSGYSWLLTMDQDSSFVHDSCRELVSNVQRHKNVNPNLSLFSANYHGKRISKDNFFKIITSGSIVKISSAVKIGGWNNKLFLDGVDYDFALRLRGAGFEFEIREDILLNHRIGTATDINFLFFKVKGFIHNPVRTYYCFRNGFYLILTHSPRNPKFGLSMAISMLRYLGKIIFSPNRFEHLKMIFRGFNDSRKGKFGEYNG